MKHEKPPAIVASATSEMRSGIAASIGAISLRPPGYLHSLVIGFVIGCLVFLLGNAGASRRDVTTELPILLACAAGGAVLAMAANFVAERRIRAEREAQRANFARYMFGPIRELPSPRTR